MSKGIKIKDQKIGVDIYFVLGSIALVIILALIKNSISRIDGVILVLFFILSYYRIFKKSTKYRAKLENKKIKNIKMASYFVLFFISILVLFISSKYAVGFASLIAIDLKFPEIIIGIFLLSLTTNLPELAFGFKAIKLGFKEMALGNLIGGVLSNIGLVTGIVAIIHPIEIEFMPFIITSLFLLMSGLIFTMFLKSKKELNIIEGIGLILLYILFMTLEFFMK
jgi:cation:H+ antiporter